jgi:glycosyltransferase involved in cell wall biosynthesis
MTAPVFSVIMPVWNRAEIIHRAIASVQQQDFPDYELIIVDDGSTDDLKSTVAPYLGDRIRVIPTSHRGVGAARNSGIRAAEGTFIAYLDSDNTWYPAFLSRMLAALTSGQEPRSAAYCRFNQYNRLPFLHIPYLWRIKGMPFSFEDLLVENYIDINTFVHARTCIAEVGYWDETLKRLVDWDFIIRLTARYRPAYVPEALVNYYYQVFENSISSREPLEPALAVVREKIRWLEKK